MNFTLYIEIKLSLSSEIGQFSGVLLYSILFCHLQNLEYLLRVILQCVWPLLLKKSIVFNYCFNLICLVNFQRNRNIFKLCQSLWFFKDQKISTPLLLTEFKWVCLDLEVKIYNFLSHKQNKNQYLGLRFPIWWLFSIPWIWHILRYTAYFSPFTQKLQTTDETYLKAAVKITVHNMK